MGAAAGSRDRPGLGGWRSGKSCATPPRRPRQPPCVWGREARRGNPMTVNCSRSPRLLAVCLAVSAGLALASIAPSRVSAQGTPEQRAACEEEAKYLCANYIPDEQQITACMVRNVHSLSPKCRATFQTKKKAKHK